MMINAELTGYDVEQLNAFHDLLPALARGLDVRDIFKHLSAVASRIVPHDEANLALLTEDGSQFRLYASTRSGGPEVICREKGCSALGDPATPHLFDIVPSDERGLRSGVAAPVRIDEHLVGVFALLSR